MKNTAKTSWDDEKNEVQTNWMKFNVPGEDRIFGTLIAKNQIKSMIPGKEGELVNVYQIQAEEGLTHRLDDNKEVIDDPIEIGDGDIWSVGGTIVIDRQMQNIRLGQIIGLKFIGKKASKTKGFAPAKIIKVYAPRDPNGSSLMDQEWVDANNF